MYVYLSISLYLYNYDYPGAQEASLREPSFAYISGCLGKIMLFFFWSPQCVQQLMAVDCAQH